MATKPLDFRKGMDGLARLVKEQLKAEPFSGVVYVFRSKRSDRLKLLWWDGSGVVLYAKRLEQGAFRWPRSRCRGRRTEGVALIGVPPGVRVLVLVATKPVDFRKGADGLAAMTQEVLKQDPLSGVVLVFRAKRADPVKIRTWDGTGLVILGKR